MVLTVDIVGDVVVSVVSDTDDTLVDAIFADVPEIVDVTSIDRVEDTSVGVLLKVLTEVLDVNIVVVDILVFDTVENDALDCVTVLSVVAVVVCDMVLEVPVVVLVFVTTDVELTIPHLIS